MEKIVLKVEGMSCEHCVKSVKTALTPFPCVGGVSVDLKEKTVTVEYDSSKCTLDKIKMEIEEQGYEVIG